MLALSVISLPAICLTLSHPISLPVAASEHIQCRILGVEGFGNMLFHKSQNVCCLHQCVVVFVQFIPATAALQRRLRASAMEFWSQVGKMRDLVSIWCPRRLVNAKGIFVGRIAHSTLDICFLFARHHDGVDTFCIHTLVEPIWDCFVVRSTCSYHPVLSVFCRTVRFVHMMCCVGTALIMVCGPPAVLIIL